MKLCRPDIRLVICDIDGTIIRRDETLPPEFVKAVAALNERKIPFAFASGRLPYMITPYINILGLNYPNAACNGAIIYQGETLIKRYPMNGGPLIPLINEACRLGMTVLYALDGVEYCMEETDHSSTRRLVRDDYPQLRPLSETELIGVQFDKMNIIDDGGRCPWLEDQIQPLRSCYAITRYGDYGLEIVAGRVNKAMGMKAISALLEIPLQHVMAIGDSENDNLMLQEAGWGVAVANGEEATKGFADYVCLAEAGQGAAEAIAKFCL